MRSCVVGWEGTYWRLPGAIAYAGNKLAIRARWMQRHTVTIAGDHVACIHHPVCEDLQALQRRVHVAGRPGCAGFFASHMPGFDGLAELQFYAALLDSAVVRKSKFKMRIEPLRAQRIAGFCSSR